jgi:hypothetical protein
MVPVAASMVMDGYQVRLMLVLDGNVIGSHTYWESLTGPPQAPAQRSPMYR